MTFCNISIITEDIYEQLKSMCTLSKEQSILSRDTIQNAFFFLELFPLFNFSCFILYRAPDSEHWHTRCAGVFGL